jgi:3-methyl-2-oxobutanoate hydroxymethyltransferase
MHSLAEDLIAPGPGFVPADRVARLGTETVFAVSAEAAALAAQGRTLESAKLVVEDARALYEAGVQLLLVEAVPPEVAGFIRAELPIPVLGIGAGADVDGQLLIVSDVLGTFAAFTPKFVKKYADLAAVSTAALGEYVKDVRGGAFPEEQHCYRMLEGEQDKFGAWAEGK